MSLNPDKLAEIQASVLDLIAFFLVAPEIIGEERSDEIVSTLISIIERYLSWLLPKGIFIIVSAIILTGFVTFIPLFYYGHPDYLSPVMSWAGSALGLAIAVPPLLLLALVFFRSHVPRGAPRRKWLMAGAFLFVVARIVKIMAALDVKI